MVIYISQLLGQPMSCLGSKAHNTSPRHKFYIFLHQSQCESKFQHISVSLCWHCNEVKGILRNIYDRQDQRRVTLTGSSLHNANLYNLCINSCLFLSKLQDSHQYISFDRRMRKYYSDMKFNTFLYYYCRNISQALKDKGQNKSPRMVTDR